MSHRRRLWFAAVTGCSGAIWVWHASGPAANEQTVVAQSEKAKDATAKKPVGSRASHRELMRKKLDSAQNVLEGLALEDFRLVAKGAAELKAASTSAEFNVINDGYYNAYAAKFRRTTEKMVKAARDKNLDGATLAYLDMTLSCVECHKYVRVVPPN
jgi:hypothetical protein